MKRRFQLMLTSEEADLIARNIDGWLDAGSCADGLEEDEAEALRKMEAALRKFERDKL